MKKTSDKIIQEAIELYKTNMTTHRISEELKISDRTVRRIIRKYNIPRRIPPDAHLTVQLNKSMTIPTDAHSKQSLRLKIRKNAMTRLNEIVGIENLPKAIILEKLIMNYVPIPASNSTSEFKIIHPSVMGAIRKINPYAIIISIHPNPKIGVPLKIYRYWKEGVMTQKEFTRTYIERLMLPDAQKRIAEIRKLKETNDVYITSFESEREELMRTIFVEFINGKLVWK